MSTEDGGLPGYGTHADGHQDRILADTAADIRRMWQIPEERRVPERWSLPAYPMVSLGVASQNPDKIHAARRVFNRYGGRYITAMSADERNILKFLELREDTTRAAGIISGAGAAEGIIRAIAALKPLAAFLGNPRITHGLGLDTDIAILSQTGYTPVGKADAWPDLVQKLCSLSGEHIKIVCASVLADMYRMRPVAAEIVTIFLKLKEFEPVGYIRAMGITDAGATTGGIDLSNRAIIPYLDEHVDARVNRMDVFSQEDYELQALREVRVPTYLVPALLGDIVRGIDETQIATTLYNGFARPQAYPVTM